MVLESFLHPTQFPFLQISYSSFAIILLSSYSSFALNVSMREVCCVGLLPLALDFHSLRNKLDDPLFFWEELTLMADYVGSEINS